MAEGESFTAIEFAILCVCVLGVRGEKCVNLAPLVYKIRPTSSEQAFFHPRWILTLLPIHQQDG